MLTMNKNIQTNNGEVSNTESNSLEQKVLCDKCDKEFLESELKYHMGKTFGGYYCKDCLVEQESEEEEEEQEISDRETKNICENCGYLFNIPDMRTDDYGNCYCESCYDEKQMEGIEKRDEDEQEEKTRAEKLFFYGVDQ
jgi:hypothetical protein